MVLLVLVMLGCRKVQVFCIEKGKSNIERDMVD